MNLYELRKAANLKAIEVVVALYPLFTENTLSSWENGKTSPPKDKYDRLVEFYNKRIQENG